MRVSVIGGASVDEDIYEQARAVGRHCAERGHTVVCGGYGGVMEAACRGAGEAGGESVGILSGSDPSAANDYVTTPIATGLGNARNPLVVLNGAGTVAVDGAFGTLSEIGHALDFGRPVAALASPDLPFEGFESVGTAAAAVDSVERRA